MASETNPTVDRSHRDAAAPEFEQAMTRLRSALYMRGGADPSQEQLLELWWAADAATSIFEHGLCANCDKPLSAHYGVEGRQCTTGAVIADMDSGEALGRTPGRPGWFTPRAEDYPPVDPATGLRSVFD